MASLVIWTSRKAFLCRHLRHHGFAPLATVIAGLAEGRSPESIDSISKIETQIESERECCGYGFRVRRFATTRNDEFTAAEIPMNDPAG
jgi:hypothetical protein